MIFRRILENQAIQIMGDLTKLAEAQRTRFDVGLPVRFRGVQLRHTIHHGHHLVGSSEDIRQIICDLNHGERGLATIGGHGVQARR